MNRVLFSVFGFEIQAYGFWIAIGLCIFRTFVLRDELFFRLKLKPIIFEYIIIFGVCTSFFGGKLLLFLTEFETREINYSSFLPWEGGFSILGSVIGTVTCLPLFLRYLQIPVIPFLDLLATYAPLLQSISRIGCFYSGCCHGLQTMVPWGVWYTDPGSFAPLFLTLHPTQLYSALLLFFIFVFLYMQRMKLRDAPGITFFCYIFLVSAERFIVDFWRADRLIPFYLMPLSTYQYIAGILCCSAMLGILWLKFLSEEKKKDDLLPF